MFPVKSSAIGVESGVLTCGFPHSCILSSPFIIPMYTDRAMRVVRCTYVVSTYRCCIGSYWGVLMEYMLLKDGSIKMFKCLPTADNVIDALHDFDGKAYYWFTTAFNWCCILRICRQYAPTKIDESEVPEIIKLAAMLE